MAGQFLFQQNKASAITARQFIHAFQRICLNSPLFPAQRARPRLPRKLGLAISGGADSMALAYLCRQWELHQAKLPLDDSDQEMVKITAFVVDHRAREESTREAMTVAGWLDQLGIDSQILPLTWPSSSKSGGFETNARRLRFQALGEACRDRNISTLLMGHHQDDTVETTLLRLCGGARGAGLAGIAGHAKIPECHGLYGVSESGSSVGVMAGGKMRITPDGQIREPHPTSSSTGTGKREDRSKMPTTVSVSTGGITVCRPLLDFPKANLLATCEEEGVPFVTDPTNFDPTLTPRNAIRSLLAADRLPRALRAPSVLSVMESSRRLIEDTLRLSDNLLGRCRILDLNLSSGSMVIRFPSSVNTDEILAGSMKRPPGNAIQRSREIQTFALRRITEIISPFPENHFPLDSYERCTYRVFFERVQNEHASVSENDGRGKSTVDLSERQTFTLGSVMFQPLRNTHNADNVWLLTRQPFMRNRDPILHLDVEPSTQTPTPWKLWDNRYWFRFRLIPDPSTTDTPETQNPAASNSSKPTIPNRTLNLTIRPFTLADLQALRRAKDNNLLPGASKSKQFPATTTDNHPLKPLAANEIPIRARHTLPLVVLPTSTVEADSNLNKDIEIKDRVRATVARMEQQEELLFFPTFSNSRESLELQVGSAGYRLECEWMYKTVDLKALGLLGWEFEPGSGFESETPGDVH